MSIAEEKLKVDDSILLRRVELSEEKATIAKELSELGISGNRAYFARGTIAKDLWQKRTELAGRYTAIEKELLSIKNEIRKIEGLRAGSDDIFKQILIENFGEGFLKSIFREIIRRRNGEPPVKIQPPTKGSGSINNYREELKKSYEKMIEARRVINKWIDENEPVINKADYLKTVSMLNKSLPSVSELQTAIYKIR